MQVLFVDEVLVDEDEAKAEGLELKSVEQGKQWRCSRAYFLPGWPEVVFNIALTFDHFKGVKVE